MILTAPAAIPVTLPEASTVPLDGTLLVQLPPAVPSESDTTEPTHTGATPVIGVIGLTVTIAVFWQPVGMP